MSLYSCKTTYPNLLVLGSQKSGTTSLFSYLSLHPDIFGSNPVKEPGFFSNISMKKNYFNKKGIIFDDREQLLNKYMLRGYKKERYILDGSTDYTIGNSSKNLQVVDNLSNYDKGSFKFLFIVRNPLDRIVSCFFHIYSSRVNINNVTNLFELFMDSSQWDQAFLTTLYFTQINHYFESFSRDQFHILTLDDLKSEPERCLKEIFKFLDLQGFIYSSKDLEPSNEAVVPSELKKLVRKSLINHPKFRENKDVLYADMEKLSQITKIDHSWFDFN